MRCSGVMPAVSHSNASVPISVGTCPVSTTIGIESGSVGDAGDGVGRARPR